MGVVFNLIGLFMVCGWWVGGLVFFGFCLLALVCSILVCVVSLWWLGCFVDCLLCGFCFSCVTLVGGNYCVVNLIWWFCWLWWGGFCVLPVLLV